MNKHTHCLGGMLLLAAVLPACVTTPPGPSPEEQRLARLIDETQARLDEQEKTLQQGQSRQGQSVQMSNQLRRIEDQLRELKGENERLQYQLKTAQQSQRDLYVDIDNRVQRLEARPTVSARSIGSTNSTAVYSGGTVVSNPIAVTATNLDDRAAYRKAFERLQAGEYTAATTGFEQFLMQYPDSDLRDNAQYWLGEGYYVSRNFAQAKIEFAKVINEYPGSSKLPDALLKLGYVNFELTQWQESRLRLEQVIEQFPGSTMANLAQERLNRLAALGH